MSDQVNLENSQEEEYVSKTVNVIMCDGGSGDLGHPAVYFKICLLYTSPSPRDLSTSRMPSSA